MFGTLLSWMQEKTALVFIVATANDVSQLAPEFLRKGRWNELFFVDLPNAEERRRIWDIQIAKYGRNPADFLPKPPLRNLRCGRACPALGPRAKRSKLVLHHLR